MNALVVENQTHDPIVVPDDKFADHTVLPPPNDVIITMEYL